MALMFVDDCVVSNSTFGYREGTVGVVLNSTSGYLYNVKEISLDSTEIDRLH